MADKFIWYELLTADRRAAEDFYGGVVGWETSEFGGAGTGYTILSAGGRGVGGIAGITDEMRSGGMRPGWLGYVGVADADGKARSIEAAGGRVVMEPGEIPDVGRFALVADPGGAIFYLLTPRPRDEEPPPAEPTAPGQISWHELYSSLGDKAAFDFYAGQFGWETMHEMDMGPMGTYRIFGADGVQMGATMNKPDSVAASAWGFYINVDSIGAAVERVIARGGQVLMGPHEVPGGSWIIQGLDPEGVNFALVSPNR